MEPFIFAGSAFAILFIGTALIVIAMFVVTFFLIAKSLAQAVTEKAANDNSPILDVTADVVAKRAKVSGSEGARTTYYATFEDETGARIEFVIKGEEYGMLAEGDAGILRYQGTRYLGFQRRVS